MNKYIALLVYFAVAFATTGPLLKSFYTDDDFDHVRAAIDGTEFSGREGWYNYIPLTGLVWRICWHFGYTGSAVALRIVMWVLLAICAYALFQLVDTITGRLRYGMLSGLVFIAHPSLFEVVLRLSCMHYLLGLTLQIFALRAAYLFMGAGGRTKSFAIYICCATLSIFASLHSISIIPLTAILGLTMFFLGRQIRKQSLTPLLIGMALLSMQAMTIMVSIGVFENRSGASSVGQSIVEHAWLVYYLLSWHIPLGSGSYIALCGFRIVGIPVIPFLIFLLPAAVYFAIVWRNRYKKRDAIILVAFSLAGLLCSVLIPPKSYAMPRYLFYASPWASIIIAFVLIQLLSQSGKVIGRIVPIILLVMLSCSSIWCYYHQIKNQQFASTFTLQLVTQVMREPHCENVAIDKMPGQGYYGAGLTFPRSSFYWVGQAFKAITFPIMAESKVNHIAQRLMGRNSWEIYPDSHATWDSNTTMFLALDESGRRVIREQTAAHLRLTRGGSTKGEP